VRPASLVYHITKKADFLFQQSTGQLHFIKRKVTSVNQNISGILVQCDAGTIETKKIVYCTNAYTNELLPECNITPIRNQVLVTKPLQSLPLKFAITCNSGYEYLSPREDGRIVLGGMRYLAPNSDINNADDSTLHPDVSQGLRTYLQRQFPDLQDIEVDEEWAGIMGWTPDRLALVGKIPNRKDEFICAGFSGHGMPRAHLCAKQVALLVLGFELDEYFPKEFLIRVDRLGLVNKFDSKL
jgi:glycine/D-amino acid oxidase-like deaminating enzyme